MLRALFRETLSKGWGTGVATQFPLFESTQQSRMRAKEIRDVKLIGTIFHEPFTLKDGAKLITIKTVQPDNHYKLHRAIIKSPKILNLIGNNLTIGQRVFVSGELRSTNFVNNENQNRQMFQISVNELYGSKLEDNQSDSSEPKRSIDQNSVFLLAHIASEVQHFDNLSRFFVATHFTQKDPVEGDIDKTSFLNVFVHDPDLIRLIKNNLQKRDRVFISGLLGNKPETDVNGQKKMGGHIEATNILKVDRFSESSNENIFNENLKSANE